MLTEDPEIKSMLLQKRLAHLRADIITLGWQEHWPYIDKLDKLLLDAQVVMKGEAVV